MGDIDMNVKNFLKIDSVFAQLFSQGVYGGQVELWLIAKYRTAQ